MPTTRSTAECAVLGAYPTSVVCEPSPQRELNSQASGQALSDMLRLAIAALMLSVAIAPACLAEVIPPPMPKRPVPPLDWPPPGELIDVIDGDCRTVLFVPTGYGVPEDGRVSLTVHFHTTEQYIIGEHLRRGMQGPLLVVNLGQGSSVYARPFLDVDRFGRLLEKVAAALSTESRQARIAQVDITSFSAGYGAVREILQQDKCIDQIRRVILADSLYASWEPGKAADDPTRRPALENMQPFSKFLKLAAAGKKTFVLTHSQVPTEYANTAATAGWIIEHVGAQQVHLDRGALPATLDPEFPLESRADKGRLHVWGYGGDDLHGHLTHVRHIADIWLALDASGED